MKNTKTRQGVTLLESLQLVSSAARDVHDRFGQAASEGIIAEGLVVAFSVMANHLQDEVRRADGEGATKNPADGTTV